MRMLQRCDDYDIVKCWVTLSFKTGHILQLPFTWITIVFINKIWNSNGICDISSSLCETLFSVFHMYLVTLQADGRKCQNGTHYMGDIKNKPLGSKCQRALHQNNTRMCSSEMSSWWANTWNKKMSFALTDVFMKPLMGKSRFSTRFSFNRALRSALHEEMIKM